MNPTHPPGQTPGLFDPSVASDGLTIDVDGDPIDLVALENVINGKASALTSAERGVLLLLITPRDWAPVGYALGISPDSVKRAAERARHQARIGAAA